MSQPAVEVTHAPEFVEAKVNHLIPTGQKPQIFVRPMGEGETARPSEYAPFKVQITNIRPVAGDLHLDREGLALVDATTAMQDFYDEDEVERVYYPEIEQLLKDVTGAKKVVVFDHTRRIDLGDDQRRKDARGPVPIVHNDYTPKSGPQRVRDLLPEDEAEEWLQHRYAIINVWRPITGPVETSPLAVADATSMDIEDFIASDLIYEDRVGEIFDVAHNPKHRWYYAPHMERDEALLLKCYDSAEDGRARFTAHTAFRDPTTPEGAAPRESIEIRTLCLFEE